MKVKSPAVSEYNYLTDLLPNKKELKITVLTVLLIRSNYVKYSKHVNIQSLHTHLQLLKGNLLDVCYDDIQLSHIFHYFLQFYTFFETAYLRN